MGDIPIVFRNIFYVWAQIKSKDKQYLLCLVFVDTTFLLGKADVYNLM